MLQSQNNAGITPANPHERRSFTPGNPARQVQSDGDLGNKNQKNFKKELTTYQLVGFLIGKFEFLLIENPIINDRKSTGRDTSAHSAGGV